ncbi:MAG: peptide-methionine (S)-S-oxide reductase [Ekhidna sp.]
MSLLKIGLGGGCHWCTEGVFSIIKGISQIEQGWIASTPPFDDFSEAIIVHYDPEIISLNNLIQMHLHTHACTSNHSMRGKYRSAIYVFNNEDKSTSQNALDQLSSEFDKPIITQVLDYSSFKPTEEKYQDYYQKNPEKPFCQTYIEPKVKLLIASFKEYVK